MGWFLAGRVVGEIRSGEQLGNNFSPKLQLAALLPVAGSQRPGECRRKSRPPT
jgi:hypothetical protein